MAQVPTGTTFFIASAFGSSINTTAVSNATEAVVTTASPHGYANGDIENETVFDEEAGRYLVVSQGWMGDRRVHGCLVHVELRGDKVTQIRRLPYPAMPRLTNHVQPTGDVPIDEVPEAQRFVYLKDGLETGNPAEATERVPIVEVRMISVDVRGNLIARSDTGSTPRRSKAARAATISRCLRSVAGRPIRPASSGSAAPTPRSARR